MKLLKMTPRELIPAGLSKWINILYQKSNCPKLHKMIMRGVPLFVKILLTCMLAILTMAFLGWTAIRSWIEPPEIPDITQNVAITSLDNFAFLPLDDEEEKEGEMFVWDGSRAPEGFTADDRKEQFYTFLIIGIDDGVNTDAIVVASFDGINKEVNIISIPRDSLVNVTRRIKKISAAFPIGSLRGRGREGGIAQLQRELKTIIGFIPDFYIAIELDALPRIIDALGGIEVYVPIDMRWNDRRQNLRIDIRRGLQRLDGENAAHFVRYRRGSRGFITITDYQRIENQQAAIKAMLTELMRPWNIFNLPALVNIFNEHVHSDISFGNMAWFAEQLLTNVRSDAFSMYTIPTIGTSGPPMYYEVLNGAEIIELVNRTINPYMRNIEARHLSIITRY